jgi:membrane-bound ClpP family serine protease
MPCLFLVLFLAFPRIALVLMFLSSTYLQRAYHSLAILALGFVFLPLTTIVYAWLVNSHQHIEGVNLLILIVAVLIDAGGLGSGEYHRRGR